MANSKLTKVYYFSVFLIFILFSLYLISAINAHIFTGKVIIGSNTSTTGAFVAAYINGVMKANCTVGSDDCGFGLPSYSYSLLIEGSDGDALVFTIYNVTANDTYTFASNTLTPLNLTITQLANAAVCKWSEACSGGYCCLRSTEYHGNGIGACQARACTVIPSIFNPANTTYSAGMTLDFNVSIDDSGNCSISIDAAANVTMTRINSTWFNYANTFTTVGAHQVKYSCNDSNNDFNYTSTRWFSIDASSPNISIASPANNSNLTGTAENITVIIEDANKNYTGVFAALHNSTGYYKLDGTKLTNAAYTDWTNLKRSGTSTSHFNATLNANNFADGSYLIYVNASDNTTNVAQNKSINITVDNAAPSVSLISPTNATSTTTAAQTFQCNASDPQQVNNVTFYLYDRSNSSIVKMSSTAVTGTYNQTNFSYTIPYTGTFLWNCRANDSLGNIGWASSNRTIIISTTTTTTTSTGGGGGGGGGAVSTEVSQSKYSGLVGAGGTKELTYTKEELKITSIEITAATQIDNAGITVKESSASKAGIAISSSEGEVYKYLEITKTLITDAQISKVKISFKVEKLWYDTNNYDVATTILRRKVGDAWQDLPTTKLSEDTTYYYFEAESSGLSYFAIVAKKVGAEVIVPPEEKKAVCGDNVCEYNETCSNCIADCACSAGKECVDNVCKEKAIIPTEKPGISTKVLWAVGIVIMILIIIFLVLPKKKKNF